MRINYHDPYVEVDGTLSVSGNTTDFQVGGQRITISIRAGGAFTSFTTSTGMGGGFLGFENISEDLVGEEATIEIRGPSGARAERTLTLEENNHVDDVRLAITPPSTDDSGTETVETTSTDSSDSGSSGEDDGSGGSLPGGVTRKQALLGAAVLAAAAVSVGGGR